MRIRLLLVPIVGALTLSCTDETRLVQPPEPEAAFTIADAERGFKEGFYWLPPIIKQPSYTGAFDAALFPEVEICELNGDDCGALLVTFTMAGSGSAAVRLEADGEHFIANWHLSDFSLSPGAHYRISVRAGEGVLLGYADVEPVRTGRELKNVNTDELIGLIDGSTLPIKFRIEQGVVGSIVVDPVEAQLAPGESQRFTASLFDLHGSPMSAPIHWASDDENVASIDQDGLAIAVGDGDATVIATAEQIHGTASVSVTSGDPAGLFSMISVGTGFTCGLVTPGRAYCWGRGSSGQLGNGMTVTQLEPVAVTGDHEFIMVSAGSTSHTCAVRADGSAYCWGWGSFGQLGNGSTAARSEPTQVTGDHEFTILSAGGGHTCGLTTEGSAYCWGLNHAGQLGNGSTDAKLGPFPVSGNHEFAMISARYSSTCGVTKAGDAYCWGLGHEGQLGNGSTDTKLEPFPVSGNHIFAMVSTGEEATCGVTAAGDGYCWGWNGTGGLGNGSTTSELEPSPVSGNHKFATISATDGGRVCALTTAGEAYCWGWGADGQLGNGSPQTKLEPFPVSGNLEFGAVSAGEEHTCGMTTDGKAYCWGVGHEGQLGNGSTDIKFEPFPVAPLP